MPKLPRDCSGRAAARAFMRDGWVERDLGRPKRSGGSHNIALTKPGFKPMIIADHPVLRVGTLSAYIKHAGLTNEQFMELLD